MATQEVEEGSQGSRERLVDINEPANSEPMMKDRAGTGEEETDVNGKIERRTEQSDEVLEEHNVLDEVEIDSPENEGTRSKQYGDRVIVKEGALLHPDSAGTDPNGGQLKKETSQCQPSNNGTNYDDEEFDNDQMAQKTWALMKEQPNFDE